MHLCLLNRVFYCYSYYTSLKPINHSLLPHFSMGPGILHTLVKPQRHLVNTFLRHYEKQRQTDLESVVPLVICSLF